MHNTTWVKTKFASIVNLALSPGPTQLFQRIHERSRFSREYVEKNWVGPGDKAIVNC